MLVSNPKPGTSKGHSLLTSSTDFFTSLLTLLLESHDDSTNEHITSITNASHRLLNVHFFIF